MPSTAIGARSFGSYRANILTYSLCQGCADTGDPIDLRTIWQLQDVWPTLQDAITAISKVVLDGLDAIVTRREGAA